MMTLFGRRWFVLLLALSLSGLGAGAAAAATSPWTGDAHAAVRLLTASDAVGSAKSLEAGLEFRFGPGWHGYWRTPGDAGLPPAIDWSASPGLAGAEVAWPAPHRLVVEGLQNAVFDGDVLLPVRLTPGAPGAPLHLAVTVGYAACSNICVPYEAKLDLALPAGPDAASPEAAALAAARAAIPGPPAEAGLKIVKTALTGTGTDTRLVVDLASAATPLVKPDLFVEGIDDGMPAAPAVALADGGHAARLTVALPARPKPDAALTLTVTDGPRAAAFRFGPAAASPAAASPAPVALGTWAALASALLGGFILNLMPCVLPVLSIKLLGLTRHAGAERRAIRAGFVATALGILACFGVLAGVLCGLKLSGATLGWGIQFQQPWFLAGMATLTVLFAASFFEWLPINLPSSVMSLGLTRARLPLLEAFLTGAFATLLATPCSAPFVGTAVGFALAQGPAEILAVFLCLGIGMALPYGAAALFPNVVRWLPRPGGWMLALRQGLGLLLLGTAVWLLAVLWSTAGALVAAASGLLLAGLLGFRAWVTLRSAAPAKPWPRRITAALALGAVGLSFVPAAPDAKPQRDPGWQAFDPAAVSELVAAGRTVLVDVTASWCLTCKVNELAALGQSDVKARLDRPDTIRMRADWSRPDPLIAAYLQRFARYGIPLDVVYGPGRPDGEALPELLSPGIVLAALQRAGAARVTP